MSGDFKKTNIIAPKTIPHDEDLQVKLADYAMSMFIIFFTIKYY